MNLYRWHSKALRNYRAGDILVIGVDVEDARAKARLRFLDVIREEWEWLFSVPEDEDDAAEIGAKIVQFEADIAEEPEIAETFFIRGGE